MSPYSGNSARCGAASPSNERTTDGAPGQRLRISQMHVSRLRAHALGYLRLRLLDAQEVSTAAPRTGG